jgi:eukaryotic-like serine/threonine-protein kinase
MPPILGDAARDRHEPTYRIVRALPTGRTDTYLWVVWHEGFAKECVQKMVDMRGAPTSIAFAEPRLLEQIAGDGIVRVHEAQHDGENPGWVTFVMDYFEGGSVRSALEEGHRFSVCESLDIVADALVGLERLQRHYGYIHRDPKPGNILLASDRRRGVLTDLDSVAQARSGRAPVESVTYAYLAPEALPDGATTFATDVYAMGVTLFEMLNGPIEWHRMDMGELMVRLNRGRVGPLPRLLAWEPHVPREVIRLVRKATHIDPHRRFADARSMLLALRSTSPIDWRRIDGTDATGVWEGSWPRTVSAKQRRAYRIVSQQTRRHGVVADAFRRLPGGQFRRFGIAPIAVDDQSGSDLRTLFARVEMSVTSPT